MSEESSCSPLWLTITIFILCIIDVVLVTYHWYDRGYFNRREKLQKSKKIEEGKTPTEGQTTETGEQP